MQPTENHPHSPADRLAARASDAFAERFGRPPRWVAVAPGRVNLIGEHTDYNGGHVLPMALERHTAIAADRPLERDPDRGPAPVRLFSTAEADRWAIFPADDPFAGEDQPPAWSRYVGGVLAGFLSRGLPPGPFDALIDSDLPLGGGLSSSAALEVAAATLLEAITDHPLDPLEKARLCQTAEREHAGVPCGIMDPFASVMGREDRLMLLDCGSLRVEHVPFDDPEAAVVIANTRVRHELAGGEYAKRRADCEAAAHALGVEALCDLTPSDLAASEHRLDPLPRRRARHVIHENARTIEAARFAAARDWPALGRLMYRSHDSLRDDYEVSCRELDAMVDLARSIGEAGGVYGSRMTGGGFGGCTVSIVRADDAESIMRTLREQYHRQTGLEPAVFATRPAAGACLIDSGIPPRA